ncbi:hypothetical protein SAMN05216388_102830 [Halorientalis persicus]|uniref:Type I restriction enzyme R protein N terminus (HSDR_N) n=1 Tax=Halorientalis persicus TaxID=1367881 RepID=A0A1H8UKC9_9EURY|nr:hypothetical protein [Halorientalis persicus]SEP03635.1 hypothetical protein SAMN05216388_102830 [Halorientalis persicus]
MNEDEVRQAVSVALEKVNDEDADLLRFDINERSITHRLGMYLQEAVEDHWDVDVEYNRVGGDETKEVPEELLTSGSQGRVVPDVILHQRGSGEHNILVVEAKKSGNPSGGDRQKIRAYMQHLDYDYGLFVRFETGQDFDDPGYSCEWQCR